MCTRDDVRCVPLLLHPADLALKSTHATDLGTRDSPPPQCDPEMGTTVFSGTTPQISTQ